MTHETSSSGTEPRPGTDLDEVRKVLREMRTVANMPDRFFSNVENDRIVGEWETIISHALDVSTPATFGRIALSTMAYQTGWQALHAKPVPGTKQDIYIPDFEPTKIIVHLDLRDAEK